MSKKVVRVNGALAVVVMPLVFLLMAALSAAPLIFVALVVKVLFF